VLTLTDWRGLSKDFGYFRVHGGGTFFFFFDDTWGLTPEGFIREGVKVFATWRSVFQLGALVSRRKRGGPFPIFFYTPDISLQLRKTKGDRGQGTK